jgi:hypothetical protein
MKHLSKTDSTLASSPQTLRIQLHEWLCLVAGAVLVLFNSWWMDDAFIYFRYVDNFVFLGRGLVYNPGEYVEGYTSPLWLLWLTTFRAVPPK